MDFIPGVDGEGIPRVLACFMHALMTGAPLQLVDGGRQRRSFLDVGEFVEAVVRMLDRPRACQGRSSTSATRATTSASASSPGRWRDAYRALRPDAPAPRLETVTAEAFYGAGLRRLGGRVSRDRQGGPAARLAAAARPRGDAAGDRGGLPGPLRGRAAATGRRSRRGRGRPAERAMKLAIVVPAYNAARHLPGVVERIAGASAARASRGSSSSTTAARDDTDVVGARAGGDDARAACSCARPRNGGYGAAMKDGLAAARRPAPSVWPRVHADGQYSPEVLADLLRALDARGPRSAAGLAHRRRAGAARAACRCYKYRRQLARSTSSRRRVFGLPLTDFHSGYLVYGPRALASCRSRGSATASTSTWR